MADNEKSSSELFEVIADTAIAAAKAAIAKGETVLPALLVLTSAPDVRVPSIPMAFPSDKVGSVGKMSVHYVPLGFLLSDERAAVGKRIIPAVIGDLVQQVSVRVVAFLFEAWMVARRPGELKGSPSQQTDRQEAVVLNFVAPDLEALMVSPIEQEGTQRTVQRQPLQYQHNGIMSVFSPTRNQTLQ